MDNEIIIVGNGTSLLQKENGSLIDSFSNIVRFNMFSINNYQQYVGERTTHWATCVYRKDINAQFNNDFRYTLNLKKLFLHTWEWNLEKNALFKHFSEHPTYKNIIQNTKIEDIIEIQEYVGNKDYFPYSTGAIVTWLLSKEFKMLHLTGFDWWNTPENQHHYHNKEIRGTLHQPHIEKKFFDKLESEGKLKFL